MVSPIKGITPPPVVSLPMRDGNSYKTYAILLPHTVVSLPMRDGNTGKFVYLAKTYTLLLAYL